MFKVQSLVLTAALYGSPVAVSAAGCYPTWSSGTTYASGDTVSATKSETTTTTQSCTTGVGCVNGSRTVETTTQTTYNYNCIAGAASAFCGQRDPTGIYGSTAWVDKVECSGTASATSATVAPPAEWAGGGCPKPFSSGTDYSATDVAAVAMSGYTGVYQCKAAPVDQFCSMTGYEPGDSQYWEQAWTFLGSCSGTISPTGSPSYDALTNQGGCPATFDDGATYEEGDKIAIEGLVYQCKSFPSSLHCSQTGYEPGTSIGSGAQIREYWREAWMIVGYCSGTISPTTSPNYVTLQDMGGCPDAWSAQTYEEGDTVSDGALVYSCKAWPFSGHCGQAGYEPNTDPATPGAWKDAWTVTGYCSGSRSPTTSPTIDPATSLGACPEEWARGSNVAYEEGDMVSATVSETPLRKVAFRCKAWPYSGFCGQLSPLQFGGDQGWEKAGGCDGSIGPTQAPSFDTLTSTGEGCPAEWSSSTTTYEAGDQVAYTVSDDPARKIVYECRPWPNSGYCNQGAGFEPGTTYSDLAWTLKGYCDGTLAPTMAPQAYNGTCEYTKLVVTDVPNCTPGSSGCSCTSGQSPSPSCVEEVTTPTPTPVEPWTNGKQYVTDDVVRVGLKRFRCREWPNFFWCRMEAYMPTLEATGIWPEAWRTDGMCS